MSRVKDSWTVRRIYKKKIFNERFNRRIRILSIPFAKNYAEQRVSLFRRVFRRDFRRNHAREKNVPVAGNGVEFVFVYDERYNKCVSVIRRSRGLRLKILPREQAVS